jgi:hypothetical protein
MSNETETEADALVLAIDRMKDALEEAKGMPGWGVALVVLVSLLSAIILLHVLALITATPCLWALWKRRVRQQRDRLLEEGPDEGGAYGMEILEPPPDDAPNK